MHKPDIQAVKKTLFMGKQLYLFLKYNARDYLSYRLQSTNTFFYCIYDIDLNLPIFH